VGAEGGAGGGGEGGWAVLHGGGCYRMRGAGVFVVIFGTIVLLLAVFVFIVPFLE